MDTTPRIDALEAKGPFVFAYRGLTTALASPSDMSIHLIAAALYLEHVPGTPNMPRWRERAVVRAWAAHHDLPTLQHLQRLCYVVERYHDAIEYDLRAELGVDLDALWRARRFRRILNYVDHLPRHTWYSEAVSLDEEHAEMLAKALAAQGDDGSKRQAPPMHTWTPEVDMLAKVVDAVRSVNHTLAAVNSEKGKAPKPPEPEARPKTALDGIRQAAYHAQRQAKHNALTMRLLPHKRPPGAPAKP